MSFKKILNELNIFNQCSRYGLSFWQCPQFLFLVMGLIIIGSTLTAYAIGNRYIKDPEMVTLIVLAIAAVLFVIASVITRSFERLAEASRMKSEFISIVSHQLRSPLTNLRWALDILMSGDLGQMAPKQQEYLTIIQENGLRMGELISDLLTVSRIETATLPLQSQEFNLEGLIRNLINEFKPFASASNVQLNLEAGGGLPSVVADPSQIKQVVANLIDNAIRYSASNREITIKLARQDNNAYFSIKDRGVGIPKEDQKYIFQKFFRSRNALHYQTHGSGLGLFIAKSIIERSQGKIGFQSEEGKGSIFWFTLPIKS